MTVDLTVSDIKIIQGLCDVALKQGGIANLAAVNQIMGVITKPLLEEQAAQAATAAAESAKTKKPGPKAVPAP